MLVRALAFFFQWLGIDLESNACTEKESSLMQMCAPMGGKGGLIVRGNKKVLGERFQNRAVRENEMICLCACYVFCAWKVMVCEE